MNESRTARHVARLPRHAVVVFVRGSTLRKVCAIRVNFRDLPIRSTVPNACSSRDCDGESVGKFVRLLPLH